MFGRGLQSSLLTEAIDASDGKRRWVDVWKTDRIRRRISNSRRRVFLILLLGVSIAFALACWTYCTATLR